MGGMGSSDVKLQYIDDDPDSYANIFDNAKTKVKKKDQARLIAALKKLSEGDTSAVDTDAVAMYMAVHNFLCNGDSYTGSMVHNYYLYEKDGVMSMIPWDYNLAFGGFTGGSDATGTVNTAIDTLVSGGDDSDRPMAGWITASDESLALYHEKYQQFIDTVFTSGWFESEFDRVSAMIAPYVEKETRAFYSYEEFQTAADTLKTFCLKRAQSVQGQLDGSIPATSAAQQGSDALIDASELSITAMGGMNNGKDGDRGGNAASPVALAAISALTVAALSLATCRSRPHRAKTARRRICQTADLTAASAVVLAETPARRARRRTAKSRRRVVRSLTYSRRRPQILRRRMPPSAARRKIWPRRWNGRSRIRPGRSCSGCWSAWER